MTKIEWTDESWNPVTGCTKVSAGCANCYAEAIAKRFWRIQYPAMPATEAVSWPGRPRRFSDVQCHPERLDIPLRWRKPRMIFVCSMGDLFHEKVPVNFLKKVFGTIEHCPHHIFQILTKRPERMAKLYKPYAGGPRHLWLGTSVENQDNAWRITELLKIPAAVRFVSCEPLLGPVSLLGYRTKLNWVIVGCESGPHRRECKLEWVRGIVEQCTQAGVRVFVKQLSINGKVSHDPNEWPADLRRREMPGGNDG